MKCTQAFKMRNQFFQGIGFFVRWDKNGIIAFKRDKIVYFLVDAHKTKMQNNDINETKTEGKYHN